MPPARPFVPLKLPVELPPLETIVPDSANPGTAEQPSTTAAQESVQVSHVGLRTIRKDFLNLFPALSCWRSLPHP